MLKYLSTLFLCSLVYAIGWEGSGGGGGFSGDSLDLRKLTVSDSTHLDKLEVEHAYIDSINSLGGTVVFGGPIEATALSVASFGIDSADIKVNALSIVDFRSYEGFGEFRFGPDSVAWITEEIVALKTHYVLDMASDADGDIYILAQKNDYTLNLWIRDHITGNWSYTTIQSMVGWVDNCARIAVSPDGDIYVTWYRTGADGIKFRAYVDGVWQGLQTIYAASNAMVGGIDINNGVLGLTYRSTSGQIIYNESINDGASWVADTVVASGGYGSDLAFVGSTPHVIVHNTSSLLVEFVRTSPSTWSSAIPITSAGYSGVMRLETLGDTLVTISANSSDFEYCQKVGSGGWTVETVGVSSQFGATQRYSVSIDTSGYTHLIYRGADYNIYYWTNSSGSWAGTTFNTSGDCTYPAVCVDGNIARLAYSAVNQNFSMFSNTLGSGNNTGYSGITMRLNSAVSGSASSIMIDAGGYLNDSSQSGTIFIGDKNGHDTARVFGSLVIRQVNDAGPMTATGGTAGEIVFNLANSKFYGCTVTHLTAATWAALN